MNSKYDNKSSKTVKQTVKATLTLSLLFLFSACTIVVPVETPSPSETSFEVPENSEVTALNFVSALGEEYEISKGPLKVELTNDGTVLDTESISTFLSKNIEEELQARGLKVSLKNDASNSITLKDFTFLHHRANGYSPWGTLSTLKADLETDEGNNRLVAFVKRGKVPVWSMSEINAPCYSEPAELLIKELVAKINRSHFDYSFSDSHIDGLISKIQEEAETNKLAYFYVYELGFSNNSNAIEPLREFAKHESEYIRLAAISSLGIIGDTESFEELKTIYESGKLWQDRGMALKAIGDLQTEDSISFLKDQKEHWADHNEKEALWNLIIIGLYLD